MGREIREKIDVSTASMRSEGDKGRGVPKPDNAQIGAFLDHMPDAVFIHRGDRIVFANTAAAALFGAPTAQDLTSVQALDLVHPDERAAVTDLRRELQMGGDSPAPVRSVERMFRRFDGSDFRGWTRGSRVSWQGAPAFLVVIRDISDREAGQRALRESEERYKQLSEILPDAIYVHQGGRITWVNSACVRMFGAAAADQIVGAETDRFIHPSSLETVKRRRRASVGGTPLPFVETKRLRVDGSQYWAEAASTRFTWQGADAILVVIREITARREAENAIRESEMRFRQLAEASFDAILVIDDGIITDANAAASELYGYEILEMVGMPVVNLVTKAIHDVVERRMADAEEGTFDVDHVRADGSVFPVEVSAKQVELPGRNVRVLAIRNMTERRRTEDVLRTAKEAAELANRAKTEFLTNMSHELRTPLNAVIGFSEVIATEVHGTIGNRRYIEYAEDIHFSGRHLLDVINDILDVSKVESGTMELSEGVVDLQAIVQSSVLLVSGRASDRRVRLEVEKPRHSAALRADERKLKQILINLLSNAVKFTPDGGRVTVTWTSDPEMGVQISVSDTGIGIAPDDLETVLTPFRQIDGSLGRVHEGTGLGLPLAKSFIELHGGTLDIESEVGGGTTVRVRLPARRIVHGSGSDGPIAASKPD